MTVETVGKYPAQLLLDILSDGYDYVCRGYWGQVYENKWYWWYVCENGEPVWPNQISPDITPDTVLLQLRDDEDGEADNEDREWIGITLAKLAEATDWARENYSHTLAPWTVDKDGIIEDLNYDAISADIILQKIVLGDVVYG